MGVRGMLNGQILLLAFICTSQLDCGGQAELDGHSQKGIEGFASFCGHMIPENGRDSYPKVKVDFNMLGFREKG